MRCLIDTILIRLQWLLQCTEFFFHMLPEAIQVFIIQMILRAYLKIFFLWFYYSSFIWIQSIFRDCFFSFIYSTHCLNPGFNSMQPAASVYCNLKWQINPAILSVIKPHKSLYKSRNATGCQSWNWTCACCFTVLFWWQASTENSVCISSKGVRTGSKVYAVLVLACRRLVIIPVTCQAYKKII